MSTSVVEQLSVAERTLRENLHRHDLDPMARQHLERAVSHVHEAQVATQEVGKARTVHRLVSDLEKVERLVEKVRQRQSSDVVIKSIRV
ncbi:MAG: hypothetical protein IPK15_05125 [Verrucomicrobia bacterium]|jgi:hypothetical protein|nr:hypothetical protein [Verrucomicrobiota bacterium]